LLLDFYYASHDASRVVLLTRIRILDRGCLLPPVKLRQYNLPPLHLPNSRDPRASALVKSTMRLDRFLGLASGEGAVPYESRFPKRRFGAMIHRRYAENEAEPPDAPHRRVIGDGGDGRRRRRFRPSPFVRQVRSPAALIEQSRLFMSWPSSLHNSAYSFNPIKQPSYRQPIMYSFHICYGCFVDYLPTENPTEQLRFPRASLPTPTDERASS
jgi:hypothetical protein